MKVQILVTGNYMGDVIGDINKRKGRVICMETQGKLQWNINLIAYFLFIGNYKIFKFIKLVISMYFKI